LPQSVISEHITITPETLAKQGIPGQNKEKQNNDKNTICLPRQVSCTINRTLLNWGKVGQNVPQTRINTTVSTTKG